MLPAEAAAAIGSLCKVAARPWRDRAELFAVSDDGKLFGGVYPDGSFAVPGGGVDEGETPEQAAAREALEEANVVVEDAARLDVAPVTNPWSRAYARGKPGREKFRGSRTLFAGARYTGTGDNTKLDSWDVKDPGFYDPAEVIRMLTERGAGASTPEIRAARVNAVRAALARYGAVKAAGLLDGDPVIKIPDLDIPVQGAATNFPARVRTSLAQNNKTTNFLAGSAPDEALQAWNQTYLRMPPAARKEWDTQVHGIHQQWRGKEYGAKGMGDALYNHFEQRKLVTPQAWNHAADGNTPAAMAEILGAAVAKHGAPPARKPGQPISTAATPATVKPKAPVVSKAPVPAAKGAAKR